MVVVLLIRIIFLGGLIFFYGLAKMSFSVTVNHRDNLIRNPILKYASGDKMLLLDIDEDK